VKFFHSDPPTFSSSNPIYLDHLAFEVLVLFVHFSLTLNIVRAVQTEPATKDHLEE
jgi:hypothetical protein